MLILADKILEIKPRMERITTVVNRLFIQEGTYFSINPILSMPALISLTINQSNKANMNGINNAFPKIKVTTIPIAAMKK